MIKERLISFLSFLIFLWLLIKLVVVHLFWLYLWQRKEYRFDRLLAYWQTLEGKKQILNTFNPLFLGELRKPKFTLRLLIIIIGAILVEYQFYFVFLRFLGKLARLWPVFLFPVFALTLLIVFFLTPFLITGLNILVDLGLKPLCWLIFFLAKRRLEKIKPLVIGITGSYGKTATKQILQQVLGVKFKILATEASINTPLGVAKVILSKLKEEHEVFIVEMGAYKKGEIKQLTQLTKPKIGILTGINPQHGQLFGNQEKIIKTKHELIQALPKNGLAVFNKENVITANLAKKTTKVKVKTYGYPPKNYKTKLLGRFQQLNIQAALVVADYLEVKRTKTLEAIEQLRPTSLTLRLRKGWQNCLVLDDSHNSNPDGFWEALEVFKSLKAKRKIVITAGIIELGSASEFVHRRLGKFICKIADYLILTNNNFLKAFQKGVDKSFNKRIEVINKKIDLKKRLQKLVNKDTVILLEGWNWEAKKILFPRKSRKNI